VNGVKDSEIDVILVVVNASQCRVTVASVMIELAIQTFFQNYSAKTAVLVFTRCDY